MEQTKTKERIVYDKLLVHYNKGSTKQIECECGKVITMNRLEKHLESKTHKFLIYYKQRAENSETQKPVEMEAIETNISTWQKVCG